MNPFEVDKVIARVSALETLVPCLDPDLAAIFPDGIPRWMADRDYTKAEIINLMAMRRRIFKDGGAK